MVKKLLLVALLLFGAELVFSATLAELMVKSKLLINTDGVFYLDQNSNLVGEREEKVDGGDVSPENICSLIRTRYDLLSGSFKEAFLFLVYSNRDDVLGGIPVELLEKLGRYGVSESGKGNHFLKNLGTYYLPSAAMLPVSIPVKGTFKSSFKEPVTFYKNGMIQNLFTFDKVKLDIVNGQDIVATGRMVFKETGRLIYADTDFPSKLKLPTGQIVFVKNFLNNDDGALWEVGMYKPVEFNLPYDQKVSSGAVVFNADGSVKSLRVGGKYKLHIQGGSEIAVDGICRITLNDTGTEILSVMKE